MQNEPDNLRYLTDKIRRMSEADQTSFDGGGGGGYDGGMEERVKKLESLAERAQDRLVAIERDIAVIKSNYATGKDVSEAKSSIILWVVGAIFVAQLLPMVKDWIKPVAPVSSPTIFAPQAPAPAQPAAK